MVTEPNTPPWPPILGTPVTSSLAVAFAGFDGAAVRLAAAIDQPGHEPDDDDLLLVNVELSALLWFGRSAVEHVAHLHAGPDWRTYLSELAADRELELVRAFAWARNHAGHALARAAGAAWVSSYPATYEPFYPLAQLQWQWMARTDLPEPDERRKAQEDAYDAQLSGRGLVPTVQALAAWLVQADAQLAARA